MSSATTKPRTILVVDDSPVIRSVIKIYLDKLPYQVLEAPNAERALSILKLVPVDLVIADHNMPGMTGVAFVSALRADPDEVRKKTPVVLITSDTRASDLKAQGARAGVNVFLKKPVSSAGLLDALKQLLPAAESA